MKVTVVPAQVTTVEDRIMGSLSLSQLTMLLLPVFIGAAIFAGLPPVMEQALYKYLLIAVISLSCIVLSIRIKGKLIISWLVTILRYNLRPSYYLFNKNTTAYRTDYIEPNQEAIASEPSRSEARKATPRLSIPDTAKALAALDHPAATLRFETTKKGVLYVRLPEVEE